MSLFLLAICLYYMSVVDSQCSTQSSPVLPRFKAKREQGASSTPFVSFLFNKARRKFVDNIELDLPEILSKKNIPLSDEATTEEVPHVIVRIKTSEKSRTIPDETFFNITNYIIDDQEHETRYKYSTNASNSSSKQISKKPCTRILNLTKNMFDYNAQKIYHTVNGIRLRLSKEHDQRVILQMVQKQVENGLRELKAIKEKCDKDYVILSEQKKNAVERLFSLREVMKQKKELDETVSKVLDNAVALSIERLDP